MLECLFDDKSHAHKLRSGLTAEVDDALGGIAVGKEVVDEDNLVVGG